MFGDPDGHIYQALCAGDAGAIRSLIHQSGSSLLRFIHGCLGAGRAEDVEEVFNDTMLAVWRDIAEYDPLRARFKTWVFFKARCTALDRRREMARQAQEAELLPRIEAAEVSWHLILQVDLVLALQKLGALDRQVVYLCDYLGWDQRRAAGRLGLRGGALRTRLHRARERLGKMLESWHPRCMEEGGDG